MPRRLLVLLLLLCPLAAGAQPLRTEHVVLVTLDGLRWQELFTGADSALVRDGRFVREPEALAARFWAEDAAERRRRLMPFFWETIARQGQLYGHRALGSRVSVTNSHRFSYPGYHEILTGFPDERIDSNDKRPNPNRTVLEFVNEQDGFRGRVAAFGSWDVFPFIINEARSGVPVNAGFEPAAGDGLTDRERFLNELQPQIPSPWSTVRLDAFTHHYALEHLRTRAPRLLYVAYGETDDFAHDGRYDHYLDAAHRTDRFLRDLWRWIESDDRYRGRTTLLVTTDHGRGRGDEWTSHGSRVEGADEIWIAVLGPDTPLLGEVGGGPPRYQSQIARTAAALLGLRYDADGRAGPLLETAVGR